MVYAVALFLSACASHQDTTTANTYSHESDPDQAQLQTSIDDINTQLAIQHQQLMQLSDQLQRIEMQLNAENMEHAQQTTEVTNPKSPTNINKHTTAPRQAASKPQITPEEEKDMYSAAYLATKAAQYDKAIPLFSNLLTANPNSEYTDQALFWLATSYAHANQYPQAAEHFLRLIHAFPNSQKHAEAMQSLANMYKKTEQRTLEQDMLKQLIQQHPDSEQARQAQLRLH